MHQYDLKSYGYMIGVTPRVHAFADALSAVLSPGTVVMDLGAGTGFFTLLSCSLGAKKVFCVEPDESIQIARELVAANGFSDRVHFFQGLVQDFEPHEEIDVVVSDLRGVLPFFQTHIPTIIDVRERLLASRGGVLVPKTDILFLSIMGSAEAYNQAVRPWNGNDCGFDLSAMERRLANCASRVDISAGSLLSTPLEIARLDYHTIDDNDLDVTVNVKPQRDGDGHGIVVWYECNTGGKFWYRNGPLEPQSISGTALFPWPHAVTLSPGHSVDIRIRARLLGERYTWLWETVVNDANGRALHRFDQSSFLGQYYTRETLNSLESGAR